MRPFCVGNPRPLATRLRPSLVAPLCIALLAPLICAPVAPGYIPVIEEAFHQAFSGMRAGSRSTKGFASARRGTAR